MFTRAINVILTAMHHKSSDAMSLYTTYPPGCLRKYCNPVKIEGEKRANMGVLRVLVHISQGDTAR
jgi:hypothetical protein